LGALLILAFSGCSPSAKQEVIVYTSQDQIYAEPILERFSEANDIIVRAVYDSEAVKTVGLANRLLAERSLAQCDVFWNNEALRTFQLAGAGVFRETESWAIFGFRSRRLVVNTNLCALGEAPTSLVELTNTVWRGKVALAYPLFGTTATHFLALRQHWGETNWVQWCRALAANEPLLLDGNSSVVRMVGEGEAWIGLTDSDDIAAGQRAGLPIAAAPLTPEFLLIPNSVGVVRNGPNPVPAQRLFEYLQSDAVQQSLLENNALEGTTDTPIEETTLKVDWGQMAMELGPATETLSEIFLR